MLRTISLLLLFVFIQFTYAVESPSVGKINAENKNQQEQPKSKLVVRLRNFIPEKGSTDNYNRADCNKGDEECEKKNIPIDDLDAQHRMAYAAQWMVIIAVVAAVISLFAAGFLLMTIWQSRKIHQIAADTLKHTRDNDAALNRSWLDVVKAEIIFNNDISPRPDIYNITVNLKIQNCGKAPIHNIRKIRNPIFHNLSGTTDEICAIEGSAVMKQTLLTGNTFKFSQIFTLINEDRSRFLVADADKTMFEGYIYYTDNYCSNGLERSAKIIVYGSEYKGGVYRNNIKPSDEKGFKCHVNHY